MSYSPKKVPLGAVLQQAGLVTVTQVKEALEQQSQLKTKLRIGEILAEQGDIKPQTADFFANHWYVLSTQKPQQPIGQYFKQAALLTQQQIEIILKEQKQHKLKFGEMAIAKGWLKQKTVDFFIDHLVNSPIEEKKQYSFTEDSDYSQRVHEGFLKIKLKLLNLEDQDNYSEEALIRVLWWTGGQSFLTHTVFQLVRETRDTLISATESEQVDYIVKNQLLSDWENQKLSKHLKNIEAKLLNNPQCSSFQLLSMYQRILWDEVFIDDSVEQQELLKLGLVVKQQDKLSVANRIYSTVFNSHWLKQKLTYPVDPTVTLIATESKQTTPLSSSNLLRPKNILLVLALISLLSVFFNNLAKRIAVRTAFEQGNQLLKQKSYNQALAKYDRLLKIDSNYFQAWTNQGYALAGLERYEEMRQSCYTASIIEPTAVYAWNCQGEALHNLKREREAIIAFDRAIALDPNDAIFLINKSESLRSLGKNEEALKVIEKAIQVLEKQEAIVGKPQVSNELAIALTFLGNGYRNKQQYQAAINTYNRALEYSPNYFAAQIGKGIVLTQIQRYPEAQAAFKLILNNSNLPKAKQAQTWFYLGKTLCQAQQPRDGIAAFEQAIKLKPDYRAAFLAKQKCQ
ncbi:hypothetical protein NIES4102_26130 [Chondrocystis sp. NIES-4102]|nr:hypothetical protein NIES4102_26130 [Chondrocystis sp. NIES-4102]